MAPEVIMTEESNSSYTCKADIWSLGITAIEIAEKNPPLSDIHPMRALRMIATSPMGLSKPGQFSKSFVEFVNICLVKDPRKRISATDLLRHPFMMKAKDLHRQKILCDLIMCKLGKTPLSHIANEGKKIGEPQLKEITETIK